MMTSDYQLIDALIDQEDVNVDALRALLEDRDAREYLIDAHLLRRAVVTDGRELGGLDPASAASRPARGSRTPMFLSLAMAASLAVAFFAGRVTGPSSPGGASGTNVVADAATAAGPAAFPAPAPTRVIQVEFSPTPGTTGGD